MTLPLKRLWSIYYVLNSQISLESGHPPCIKGWIRPTTSQGSGFGRILVKCGSFFKNGSITVARKFKELSKPTFWISFRRMENTFRDCESTLKLFLPIGVGQADVWVQVFKSSTVHHFWTLISTTSINLCRKFFNMAWCNPNTIVGVTPRPYVTQGCLWPSPWLPIMPPTYL